MYSVTQNLYVIEHFWTQIHNQDTLDTPTDLLAHQQIFSSEFLSSVIAYSCGKDSLPLLDEPEESLKTSTRGEHDRRYNARLVNDGAISVTGNPWPQMRVKMFPVWTFRITWCFESTTSISFLECLSSRCDYRR